MADESPGFVPDPTFLLGRSVHDELVVGYMRFHEVPPLQQDIEGWDAFYGDGRSGFSLSATPVAIYRRELGEPRSLVTREPKERLVKQIGFSASGFAGLGSAPYAHRLPLGLHLGDLSDVVTEKLGVKPTSTSTRYARPPIASIWFYHRHDIVWIIQLDAEHRLAAVSVLPLSSSERVARDRKASLKAESRNIDPANIDKVEALRAGFPMPRWRETLTDGDDLFTERNIAESEALLNAYLDKVKAATARRSAPAIYAATKSLITGLNKINRRDAFIETLERDELGVLIDAIVAATGFRVKDGEDITVGWREW